MSIPAFQTTGLLPSGVYDCTISEIETLFTWNQHRITLLEKFKECFTNEIRPRFGEPLYFDGSFVTNKDCPEDIDIVLELSASPDEQKYKGIMFLVDHQSRLMDEYSVHFWINLPGKNDFCSFFQYVGVKTARFKGLDPKHLKGILRIA